MKSPALRTFVLWICLLCLASCQGFDAAADRPSAIIGTPMPSVRPPAASPTPMKCSPHPAGLSLQLTAAGKTQTFQNVRLEGQGFVAGEKLYVALETAGARRSQRLEIFDLTVQADGAFRDSESLQIDEPNTRWQAFVVHQRGVACASLVMP